MWRTPPQRKTGAAARLTLARTLWGWRPHPSQKQLFTSPAQVTVAACGRRWGKSECLSLDLATLALYELSQGRPCRQLVVAPTEMQARLLGGEVWRRLAEAAEKLSPPVTLTVRQKPALTLSLTRPDMPGVDAVISCRTAGRDGRALRGLWAHRIVVDEAAFVPDTVLQDVLLPMLLDRGGDYLLASSPHGKRSAFYRLFAKASMSAKASVSAESHTQNHTEDAQGLTYAAFQFPTAQNPHLDLAYLHSQRDEMGAALFAQEYEAQFLDVGGSVFREDDLDAALQADPRVSPGPSGELLSEPVPGRRYTVGIDWGRKYDFSVVCVLDSTDPLARVVGLWRWQGTGWETQIAHAAAIIARFDPWRVRVDASGVGDPLAEGLERAVAEAVGPDGRRPPVERFLFHPDSKQTLVDTLALRLSARRLAFPPHRALLREFRAFEYLTAGPSGRLRTGASGSEHDDIVMAVGLALLAAPEAAPAPLASLLLLGSQVSGQRRQA